MATALLGPTPLSCLLRVAASAVLIFIGAGAAGLDRCEAALLIILRGAVRTYARRDELEVRTETRAQRARLARRTHHPVEPRVLRETRETRDLLFDAAAESDLMQIGFVHAREHRHADQ